MSAPKGSFVEQVKRHADDLRYRLAALEFVAELNAQAESLQAFARDRERGGMVLDPLDPSHVTMPVVWLRALLNHSRMQGYGSVANDPTLLALLETWNAGYHRDAEEFERLRESHPEIADRLRDFLAIL